MSGSQIFFLKSETFISDENAEYSTKFELVTNQSSSLTNFKSPRIKVPLCFEEKSIPFLGSLLHICPATNSLVMDHYPPILLLSWRM